MKKRRYRITVGSKTFTVAVEDVEEQLHVSEAPKQVPKQARLESTSAKKMPEIALIETEGKAIVRAPLRGTIVSIKHKENDRVEAGELLLTLEAMKMESEIFSPESGTIKRILCIEGQSVEQNEALIIIDR